MNRQNAERRPGRGGVTTSNSSDVANDTAALRRVPRATPLVSAEVREVAGRLRDRLEMFVHCPACKALHVHRAPVDFLSGKRTAACGARYVVVAGIAREVAA